MSRGLLVGEKTVTDRFLIYDSRRVRPQVAVDRDPPHLDVFTTKGTNISTTAANNFTAREVLFSMPHSLAYIPKPLVYFYRVNTAAYGIGKLFFGFGAVDDYLTYEVDTIDFKIVHIVEDFLQIGYTSTAASAGDIRVKYLLFSNPINNLTNA